MHCRLPRTFSSEQINDSLDQRVAKVERCAATRCMELSCQATSLQLTDCNLITIPANLVAGFNHANLWCIGLHISVRLWPLDAIDD